jgi:hypothetical protein
MTAKIVSAVLTFITVAAAAAFFFIMLLVTLNGFHASDANYGVISYAVLSVVNVVAMSAAALFLAA